RRAVPRTRSARPPASAHRWVTNDDARRFTRLRFGNVTDLAATSILARAGTEARTFAHSDLHTSPTIERFVVGLTRVMRDAGYQALEPPGPDPTAVLHTIDAGAAKPYRRKAAPTFVIAIAELDVPTPSPEEQLRTGYPLLVRGLANLCIMLAETPGGL